MPRRPEKEPSTGLPLVLYQGHPITLTQTELKLFHAFNSISSSKEDPGQPISLAELWNALGYTEADLMKRSRVISNVVHLKDALDQLGANDAIRFSPEGYLFSNRGRFKTA